MSNNDAVFTIVRAIPRGTVATYGQVARLAGMPGGARAVGLALKNLPVNTCLPWHRVVNARGEVTLPKPSPNYARQIRRLGAEGVEVHTGRVSLQKFQWQA